MIDPTTVFALGVTVLCIALYNFYWAAKVIKSYMSDDDEEDPEKRSISLLTKIPLDMLSKIQTITLSSVPLLFAGIFMIIYGM